MQRSLKLSQNAIIALALLLASGAAVAAPPATEAKLAGLTVELGADSLEVRERASRALADDPLITLPMIENLLTGPAPLSPEQIERLCQKGEELFANEPRAAMGVSFSWGDSSPDGVEISGTIAGFDSQRVLQPGDVIQTLDGIRLTDQSQTRAAIVSHAPGDEVTLRVLRQGEPMVVKLILGDYSNLDNPANRMLAQGLGSQRGLDKPTLRQAWELRRDRTAARSGRSSPAAIESGLTERQWAQLDVASGHREDNVANVRRAAAARRAQLFQGGARIQIRQGGQAVIRNFPQQEQPSEVEATDAVTVAAGGSDRSSVGSVPGRFSLSSLNDPNAERRREMEAMLQEKDALIAKQEAILNAAVNMPAETRALHSNELARLRMQRSMIQAKMEQKLGHVEP